MQHPGGDAFPVCSLSLAIAVFCHRQPDWNCKYKTCLIFRIQDRAGSDSSGSSKKNHIDTTHWRSIWTNNRLRLSRGYWTLEVIFNAAVLPEVLPQ